RMRKVRYAVAKMEELPPDRGRIFSLGTDGGECALFLHEDQVYAVGSLCPHQNAPLEGAIVRNGQIVCRRHGFCYDLKYGDCTTLGGYGLPVYEVHVEGDTIYVTVWED
ncbi:MAG TPA: Rieske 2Fe-2S domain-containing protein, partial [Chthonomonadaceae bacterium]|nr:Rieske 2Fe-2S domain-containing protein [Chthonomonadaceae bacterium]